MLIETERIWLRPLIMNDLDDVLEIQTDPDIARFLGAMDREQAREWLAMTERAWAEVGYGRAAVIERSTGRFVGRAGLRYWPEFDETEVGWVLHRGAWGHGLATEAGHASLRWGFENLNVPYITAIINHENTRSIAVAQRLGMTPLREDTHYGEPVTVYAVRREEFAPNGASSNLRRVQISLSNVRFESSAVQALLDEWNNEIRATNPSFSAAGGSTVEPSEFSAPHGVFVLAVDMETPVGCGGLRRLTSTKGEIKRLFVCRAARGRGVGRALLDALEERAPRLGFTQIRLDTGGGEPDVLALFRSANYQPIEDYNGNPYARYWFEKQLSPP